jgi:Zn-dependent peptidase ImmA (M78 family)
MEERFRLDVDVSPLPEAVDGLCVSVGDRTLVLVGSSKPSSRQRFTLAHELAHYLVDDLDPLYVDERGARTRSMAEMRANAFAAHLLMPESGVRSAIGGIDDDAERAVRVALRFGTSVSAAAYQLGNLGLLPDTVRDRLADAGSKPLLMRYALPSDWQQDERGRGQVRPPGRLYGRATLAFRRGLIGLEPIADLLQRPDRDQLRQELEDAGLAPTRTSSTPPTPTPWTRSSGRWHLANDLRQARLRHRAPQLLRRRRPTRPSRSRLRRPWLLAAVGADLLEAELLRLRLAGSSLNHRHNRGEAEAIFLARRLRGVLVSEDRDARVLAAGELGSGRVVSTPDLPARAVRMGLVRPDGAWGIYRAMLAAGRRLGGVRRDRFGR